MKKNKIYTNQNPLLVAKRFPRKIHGTAIFRNNTEAGPINWNNTTSPCVVPFEITKKFSFGYELVVIPQNNKLVTTTNTKYTAFDILYDSVG